MELGSSVTNPALVGPTMLPVDIGRVRSFQFVNREALYRFEANSLPANQCGFSDSFATVFTKAA